MPFIPSPVRLALDNLLDNYRGYDLVKIEWPIDPVDERERESANRRLEEAASDAYLDMISGKASEGPPYFAGPPERCAGRWTGEWILADIGAPSQTIASQPAWSVYRFAIHRSTGEIVVADNGSNAGARREQH